MTEIYKESWRCFFGFHNWGKWRLSEAQMFNIRNCQDCNKQQDKPI